MTRRPEDDMACKTRSSPLSGKQDLALIQSRADYYAKIAAMQQSLK